MVQLSADFRYVFSSQAVSICTNSQRSAPLKHNACPGRFCSCCRPTAYAEGANWRQSVATLTASQLMDVAQRQQNSIGCCVVSASVGDIRCDAHTGAISARCISVFNTDTFGGCRCIASTMDTTTTQWVLSISCSCVQQRSADPAGSPHWAFSCPVSLDEQTSDALLANLPPIKRLSTKQQLLRAGEQRHRLLLPSKGQWLSLHCTPICRRAPRNNHISHGRAAPRPCQTCHRRHGRRLVLSHTHSCFHILWFLGYLIANHSNIA